MRSWWTHRAGCAVVALVAAAPRAAAFDRINCEGLELDDAAFAEPVVRDRRDASRGALANASVRPLGGGVGYGRIVPRPPVSNQPAKPAVPGLGLGVVVRTAGELRAALAAAALDPGPQTIYVDDAAEIDLSYCAQDPRPAECSRDHRARPADDSCEPFSLKVPAQTTLASGRGRPGSRGGRLFANTFAGCPMLKVEGPGVRISGLRLHGPDSGVENDDPIHCGGETKGIGVTQDGSLPLRWATEIDNNEMSAWPSAAIHVQRVQGVRMHHNRIQYNRRVEHNGTCGGRDYALGYGVVIDEGSVTVEANVFDHNRHDIASSGVPGSHYSALYNLVLPGAVGHSFDVHGGADRKDCTDIAGSAFVIHHNTFLQSEPSVLLRGVPLRRSFVYRNAMRTNDSDDTIVQKNASGNLEASENLVGIARPPGWFVSFAGSSFWQWQQFEPQAVAGVRAGDFDGDGMADVMRSTATGWQWSRSARQGWAFLNTLTDPVSRLGLGDFVGSSFTDVVRSGGDGLEVSEGGTGPWRPLLRTQHTLAQMAFGDFGGDHRTDVFMSDGRRWTIVEAFAPVVRRRHISQPFALGELRFGNFVGDSKLDVLRHANGEWLVWDRVSRDWNRLNSSSVPLSELTLADFDGDGFTDIARSTNGQWQVSWGGRSAWQVLNRSDLALRAQVIADFDGDRRADVLSRQSPD